MTELTLTLTPAENPRSVPKEIPQPYAALYLAGRPFIAVVGSRDFNHRTRLDRELDAERETWGDFVVVSGGARGADTLAEQWALSRRGMPRPLVYHAQWRVPVLDPQGRVVRYTRDMGAGKKRNTTIARVSWRAIAYWDGKSGGTLDLIEKMEALGKVVEKRLF